MLSEEQRAARTALVRETLDEKVVDALPKLAAAGFECTNQQLSTWRYEIRKADGTAKDQSHRGDASKSIRAYIATLPPGLSSDEVYDLAQTQGFAHLTRAQVNDARSVLRRRAERQARRNLTKPKQAKPATKKPAPKRHAPFVEDHAPATNGRATSTNGHGSGRDDAFRAARKQLFALFMRVGLDVAEEVFDEFRHINAKLQES